MYGVSCSGGTLPNKMRTVEHFVRGEVDAVYRGCYKGQKQLNKNYHAPVAESVDASDLKSDWANNSVPVQVWPGAIIRQEFNGSCLFYC